jgi:hypothetical protein
MEKELIQVIKKAMLEQCQSLAKQNKMNEASDIAGAWFWLANKLDVEE